LLFGILESFTKTMSGRSVMEILTKKVLMELGFLLLTIGLERRGQKVSLWN